MNTKKALVLLLTALLLFCTGCFGGETDDLEVQIFEGDPSGQEAPPPGEVISYTYPADPPKALKNSLDKAAGGVDFTAGEIRTWSDVYGERLEIPIYWRGEREHATLISFYIPEDIVYDDARATGREASFTIAFIDPEAMEDMITLAIPVLQHIDPGLGWDGALSIVENLLDTLTVDGFGDPVEVGGYQIQLHYTNPHIYFKSRDFTASMGLRVTALGSIWGEFSTTGYPEMTPELYAAGGRDDNPTHVRVTGTVTEWYKKPDYYGTIETFVTVEYGDGNICELRMNYQNSPYELALGSRYEFFVMLNHPRGPALIHAVQQ